MTRLILATALALCGTLLQADGLADLKAALKALPRGPKVRVHIEEESREREEGKEQTDHRSLLVEDGPEGTKVLEDSHPGKGLRQANFTTDGKGRAREKQKPGDFMEIVRPAEGLLEQLETARLLEEKAEPFERRPARRLKLALDMKLDEDARKHLKQADHEAILWIGTDSLPLAMKHRIEVRARVLLFASIWTRIDITRRFQRAGQRFLLLDEQAEVQGSALGKSFSAQETIHCSLQ